MKRYLSILLTLVVTLAALGCGTTKSTAKTADENTAVIILVDKGGSKTADLILDKETYEVKTINQNDIKKNLKKAAEVMIYVTPGNHDVCVRYKNKTIYEDRIHLRKDETKMIYLK